MIYWFVRHLICHNVRVANAPPPTIIIRWHSTAICAFSNKVIRTQSFDISGLESIILCNLPGTGSRQAATSFIGRPLIIRECQNAIVEHSISAIAM